VLSDCRYAGLSHPSGCRFNPSGGTSKAAVDFSWVLPSGLVRRRQPMDLGNPTRRESSRRSRALASELRCPRLLPRSWRQTRTGADQRIGHPLDNVGLWLVCQYAIAGDAVAIATMLDGAMGSSRRSRQRSALLGHGNPAPPAAESDQDKCGLDRTSMQIQSVFYCSRAGFEPLAS
jgi:hypothetical protein